MDLQTFESITSIGASIATVVALYAIFRQIRQERQDQRGRTLDILSSTLSGESWAGERKEQLEAMAICLKDVEKLTESQKSAIRKLLNTYELLQIYCNHGLIDERIFREFWQSTLIHDFERCEAFVNRERLTSTPKAWSGVETLSNRWGKPDSVGE